MHMEKWKMENVTSDAALAITYMKDHKKYHKLFLGNTVVHAIWCVFCEDACGLCIAGSAAAVCVLCV